MNTAKRAHATRFQRVKELLEEYEDKIETGDSFKNIYRFPEVFGAIQRKTADLYDSLPEVKLTATTSKGADAAIAANATLKCVRGLSQAQREKLRAMADCPMYGQGIMYSAVIEHEKKIIPAEDDELDLEFKDSDLKTVTMYKGILRQRVDPRDFFVDESAINLHDTGGATGARDVFIVKTYAYSSFMSSFAEYKDIDKVVPVAGTNTFFGFDKYITNWEGKESKYANNGVVVVIDYWNQEKDWHLIVANGVEIYFGAIPFRHKKLPFVIYYNYKRDDSIWGVSEVEILAPFIYAKETMLNLQIDDAKLALQPFYFVDGAVTFDENQEIEPGAMIRLRGIKGGKVSDSVMPARSGGIDQSAVQLYQQLEDLQITATGDDFRSLYANPQQLATQTLAKKEALQKRIRAATLINNNDAEKELTEQEFSNICQFLTKPYMDINGRVKYRRIKSEGYIVHQEEDDDLPKFTESYGATGYFSLNNKVFNDTDFQMEVVEKQLDELEKKDWLQNMNIALKTIFEFAAANPNLIQSVDVVDLSKQILRKFEFDTEAVFKEPNAMDNGKDLIDFEHEAIIFGKEPPVTQTEDSIYHLERHRNRYKILAERLKKASAKEKKAIKKWMDILLRHITNTIANVPNQILAKLEKYSNAGGQGMPQAAPGMQGGASMAQANAGNVPQPSGQISEQSIPEQSGASVRVGAATTPQGYVRGTKRAFSQRGERLE